MEHDELDPTTRLGLLFCLLDALTGAATTSALIEDPQLVPVCFSFSSGIYSASSDTVACEYSLGGLGDLAALGSTADLVREIFVGCLGLCLGGMTEFDLGILLSGVTAGDYRKEDDEKKEESMRRWQACMLV